jgi:hypothetical protein
MPNTLLPSKDRPVRPVSLYGPVKTEWQPGEDVERSGVYGVRHGPDHRLFSGKPYAEEHQVICVAGQTFPVCNRCGMQPRFRLLADGEPIQQHPHFP